MTMKRIGMAFSWREESLERIVSCSEYAEQVGVESVWVSEAWGRDAFLALAAVAARTKQVKLGTGIVNVFSRSPALLAMSAATLDELSNGRAILGIGTSGPAVVERWHGLRYEKPLTRVHETVGVVQKALSGSLTSFDGKIFQVKGFQLAMQPPKRKIPIYVAALGPRMLRLAGKIADGVLLYLCPLSRIPNAINELRSGAEEAKRPVDAIDIAALLPTIVSENHGEARHLISRTIAYYVGGMGTYYHRLVTESGFPSEAARIREAWQHGDRLSATQAVSEELVDSVALAGPADQCRARLEMFRNAGITLPIVSFGPIQDQMSALAVSESVKALVG
jgi:F420-dependent oxidoreductase-like protein